MENNTVTITLDALMELMTAKANMDALKQYIAHKKAKRDTYLYDYEVEAFLGMPEEESKDE